MKTRIINLLDDIIILEIKTSDCYEYYIRSEGYPFEYCFGVPLEKRFNKSALMRLFDNDYLNNDWRYIE